MSKEKKGKKKKSEVIQNTLKVLKIRQYDEDVDGFINENGSYFDLFEIRPKDRGNQQDDEISYDIVRMGRFYKTYAPDIKIVSLNFPLNTNLQKKILSKRLEKSIDEVRRKWLRREIEELEILEKNITRREYYLFIFADNKDEFIKNKTDVTKSIGIGKSKLIDEIDKRKKVQILRKLCNMNTLILPDALNDEADKRYDFMEDEE
jgi:hypothetical protein